MVTASIPPKVSRTKVTPRSFPNSSKRRSRPRAHGLSWVPVSPRRIALLRALAVFTVGALVLRLGIVSLYPSANYRSLASAEGYSVVNIDPTRGTIYDSTGNVLAVSEPRNTVVADPLLVQNPIAESQILAKILGMGAGLIRSRMLSSGQFVFIAHQITNAQSQSIDANYAALPGVNLINEPLRVRPNSALAAAVLGGVSMYGQGQGGVEAQLNSALSGKAGSELLFSAPSGSTLPGGKKILVTPNEGKSAVLTLDSAIQLRTEQALSDEMVSTQARAGVAIVMNSHTGAVLSMANLVAGASVNSNQATGAAPVADPQPHFSYTEQAPINMAVDYVYEPGSVAKIATFAAALEAGIITPSSEVVVPDHILVGGTLFHDAEVHPVEILQPKDILAQSSNVGTIMIASKLAPTVINSSFLNFGWGVPSGLNLPGESPGFLDPPSHWSGTARGSVPIGQDEAVTPLQVLDSYNAIANSGMLATPRLINKLGNQVVPVTDRKVISPSLAQVMTKLLSGVTGANGTAPAAAVDGFNISGKTGTAQIPFGGGRSGYIPGEYMATFVGFTTNSSVPLSAIVVLTEPNQMYGGLTSAKVFSQVVAYALYHQGAVASPITPPTPQPIRYATTSGGLLNGQNNCTYLPHRFGASVLGTNCSGTTRLTSSSLPGPG